MAIEIVFLNDVSLWFCGDFGYLALFYNNRTVGTPVNENSIDSIFFHQTHLLKLYSETSELC